ncbi:trimeric intracellular cation channel family protein [Actinoallomurus soli]|uniref:trimeric intracellular cation channel family protein n=1 Tax=Actinoallomurus soli TaxID=2952535 RepID=UPI002091F865|nr:TRIC cation channel family protein [Actinoallomurus soli]MCO5968394.1 TRIC cation channel family protein [Actinoallomurus soli]
MSLMTFTGAVQYAMDLIGIFAFALSGAFLAVRKDFDVFGTIILAEVAGLGGGLFRDLVLGVKPVAFTDPGYYSAPVVAALIVFFSSRIHRHARLSEVFDRCDMAALALFGVTGTVKSLSHGFGTVPAVTLGLASAVGGGVLSSVLAIEVPALFQWTRDLYLLPALTGAVLVALFRFAGILNGGTAMAAAVCAIGLRLISMYFGWHTPRAYVWRNPFAGMRQQPVPAARPPFDGGGGVDGLDGPPYGTPDAEYTVMFPRLDGPDPR